MNFGRNIDRDVNKNVKNKSEGRVEEWRRLHWPENASRAGDRSRGR